MGEGWVPALGPPEMAPGLGSNWQGLCLSGSVFNLMAYSQGPSVSSEVFLFVFCFPAYGVGRRKQQGVQGGDLQ